MNTSAVINMIGFGKRSVVIMAAFSVLVILGGCLPAQLSAYRTPGDPPDINCAPRDDKGDVETACGHASHERATFVTANGDKVGYDLFFAEFDDAGWLNTHAGDNASPPIALQTVGALSNPKDEITQIEDFLVGLDKCKPLRIVVFVHGWKHNAYTQDANVRWAREQLEGIAENEGSKRQVVGIYIGWRGTPIVALDPVQDLTFWDRKGVAEEVAQGSVNELLAVVTTYEHIRNSTYSCGPKITAPSAQDKSPEANQQAAPVVPRLPSSAPVVTVFIGHSFGGLILFEALAPRILDSLVSAQIEQKMNSQGSTQLDANRDLLGRLRRGVDMVILINPAVEATRFHALLRAMNSPSHMENQAPLMVLVTSTADEATRYAFPLARRVSVQESKSGVERIAYRETIGHMKPYITHRLVVRKDGEPACRTPMGSGRRDPLCFAESTLTPTGPYNRFPVWNVSTDKTEIASHDDISECPFVRFMIALTQYGEIPPVPGSLPATENTTTVSTLSKAARCDLHVRN